ncbi:hypothetical protein Tco_0385487 [Tanacetum coccineum]
METNKVSERYIAPCFVNGLDAYDGEINLALDENLISNKYAVKLCLDYEVKKGNKVVKKELIVALKEELYFVKFTINPKEHDVEPEVIFGRSFMRLVNGIVDFGSEVIIVYPEQDPIENDSEKIEKRNSSCNKKRAMDNLNLFYLDIGPSSSIGRHLTQGEAAKEALALRISQKFSLLEEVRPVLETMAYNYKFEGKINKNALADTVSDINTMPYRIYEKLVREEIKKVNKGITMINHTQAEPMGILMKRGARRMSGGEVVPPSPDYVPGPEEPEQAPPSSDYVPGLEHADDEIVPEDQPYAEDASPTAQSHDYVLESDPETDPEEDDDKDPEEDHVDYPADRGDDGDDEEGSSKDDEDDDMGIEANEEEEEEEHPAPADSVVVALPAADQASSTEETNPFETDESAATPPPHPAYRVTARISIPALVPTPVWPDAEVARLLAISTPPSITTPTSLPHSPSFSFTTSPDTFSTTTPDTISNLTNIN